jgi:diadenosine tetraphosphate (Ap4A) HIT family hydrolase
MRKDFLGKEWPVGCMGCLIRDREMEVPGGIGFLVIGANRHFQRVSDMTEDEYDDYTKVFWQTRNAIQRVFDVEYFSTIQEDSSNHFHAWFFPWNSELLKRYPMPSLKYIRDIMNGISGKVLPEEQWMLLKSKLEQVKKFLQ